LNTERIDVIDVIRGIALLGLLPMNILSIAVHSSAYVNPMSIDGDWWFTHFSHFITHIFLDQKMMGLFSLLFGVSVYLISERYLSKNKNAGVQHYSRSFWLIIFGTLHGVFIWSGDILLVYGMLAFLLYPFRYANSTEIMALNTDYWPTSGELQEHRDIFLGSYTDQLAFRLDEGEGDDLGADEKVFILFTVSAFLRAGAAMLLGLALAQLKFWQWRVPVTYGLVLVAVAITITSVGLYFSYANYWWVVWGFGYGMLFNWLATPLMVLGYLVLIIVVYHDYSELVVWQRLKSVGRMAFTNYLLQSTLMTTVFYGFGIGLFGQLNRLEIWLVVFATWIFQIYFSKFWLSKFRYGPMEWLWRLLTKFKLP